MAVLGRAGRVLGDLLALKMVLCGPGPKGQDGPGAGCKAHLLLQQLPSEVSACTIPHLGDFWKAKDRSQDAVSWQCP